MKNKIVIGIVVLAAVTLISGASIMAYATPGTPEDPLISLSYLTNVFRPQITSEIDSAGQELTQDIETRITWLERHLQENQDSSPPVSPGPADVFTVVTLRRNQSLTCSVGTGMMLRIGSANGFGTAPALVNYTSGVTITAGTTLTQNNMYLVTIEGNGITATADNTRVLIRGSYRVS